MNRETLQLRTKKFALNVIKLTDSLPKTRSGNTIGNQLMRSGTSVGANYRSACRGRSKAEFISKLGIALEEADESIYWLELLVEGKILKREQIEKLITEANELTSIFYASIKTARGRQ